MPSLRTKPMILICMLSTSFLKQFDISNTTCKKRNFAFCQSICFALRLRVKTLCNQYRSCIWKYIPNESTLAKIPSEGRGQQATKKDSTTGQSPPCRGCGKYLNRHFHQSETEVSLYTIIIVEQQPLFNCSCVEHLYHRFEPAKQTKIFWIQKCPALF